MDDVISRIMEIEKQSAMDVERAEDAARKNIEMHRRALDEEKERAHALVIRAEEERLTEALRALEKQIAEASLAAGKNYESLVHDPAIADAVKERIVAILLAG